MNIQVFYKDEKVTYGFNEFITALKKGKYCINQGDFLVDNNDDGFKVKSITINLPMDIVEVYVEKM